MHALARDSVSRWGRYAWHRKAVGYYLYSITCSLLVTIIYTISNWWVFACGLGDTVRLGKNLDSCAVQFLSTQTPASIQYMQDKQNSMAFNREAPSFQMPLYDLLRKKNCNTKVRSGGSLIYAMFCYLIYDKGGKKNCWEAACREFSQSHFRGLTDIPWVPFQVFIVESSFYHNPRLTRTLRLSETAF